MPRTIIVGFDGSDHARDALALGIDLANAASSELTVATVFKPFPHVGDTGQEVERTMRTSLTEAVEEARRRLTATEVREQRIDSPSPPHGLHEFAEEQHASLIVVGSSHRGKLGRILAGSVAEALLHGSPCAVAVAPVGYAERPEHPVRTIGVACDGSEESRQALDEAAGLAQTVGASLRLVGVVDPEAIGAPRAVAVGYGAVTLIDDLRDMMRRSLAEAQDAVPASVESETALLKGNAARTLADQEVDLLFCGSRGYGLAGQVLLGGTSARVVRHARSPVVVVPRGVATHGIGEAPAVEQAAP